MTGGRDTVGLRVPAHPLTQELLARSGRGIAAPSANRFGRVSPTTAEHVVADLGPYLDPARDVVLDGGPSPIGVESTIVDCTTDPPQLLRPGGHPDRGRRAAARRRRRRRHRAVPGRRDARRRTTPRGRRVALVPDGRGGRRRRPPRSSATGTRVAVVDHGDDLVTYARQLYAELRDADAAGADRIVAVLPPPRGLGHAIRDRLTKAAAPR